MNYTKSSKQASSLIFSVSYKKPTLRCCLFPNRHLRSTTSTPENSGPTWAALLEVLQMLRASSKNLDALRSWALEINTALETRKREPKCALYTLTAGGKGYQNKWLPQRSNTPSLIRNVYYYRILGGKGSEQFKPL
jgi:hypothetical protein